MHKLLQGVRVIDLSTIVLGPYATRFLADFGAEVIKIEAPGGDLFRSVRPGRSGTMGAGFISCNRNKRSLGLDLSRPEGQAVLHRLVAGADAVVHNMRPASARRIGADYERLKAIRPDLVYAFSTGFGQDGPKAGEPAYDDTIQAASGLADLNAGPDGRPRYVPTIVGDKVGGLHLAVAVLAGLTARARTGQGACIEAPMLETVTSFLMLEQLGGRAFDPPLGGCGYERLSSPNRRPHQTRDGYIAIIPYNTAHWRAFMELAGRDDLADAPLVNDPVVRSAGIDALYAVIAETTPRYTTAEWLALLGARDIPCAPVNKLDDLFDDPHLKAVGLFQPQEHPSEGRLVNVRSPFVVAGETPAPDRPTPEPGQDGEAVLRDCGWSDAEIAALESSGALWTVPSAGDGAADAAAAAGP